MKKLLTVLLASLMIFGMAGCSENPVGDGGASNAEWNEDLPVLTFSEPAEKVDWIDTRAMNNEAKLMLSSLKAVVNSEQPRIWTLEMEDSVNWLSDLGYSESDITEYDDVFELALKYKSEYSRAVIYDPETPDTINLASSYAGLYKGTLVCSPVVYAMFEQQGVTLEIIRDFRGMFSDKYEVYEWMYDNIWNSLTHKIITCLNYETPGYVRDYAIAAKSAILWLSTSVEEDVTVLRKFFNDMTPGESAFMGWFPEGDEAQFVSLSSEYGILTYPSDLSENLTFLSGTAEPLSAEAAETPAAVENKIYVAFIVSDGDNLQYHQHQMRTWWDLHNASEPDFPLTWTFNPSAYVIQPAIMNYYFENAGEMNAFMTGPSGITYNYPRDWKDSSAREKIFALTNKYCNLSGIKVVNNWMSGSGGYSALTEEEQAAFAKYYTDILAVYDQVSLGGAVDKDGLLIDSLSVNYSQVGDGTGAFIAAIAEAADRFNGSAPVFVTLQGNPWDGDMYSNFQRVYDTFKNDGNIEFVRMDELAMLQRLSMGMSAAR